MELRISIEFDGRDDVKFETVRKALTEFLAATEEVRDAGHIGGEMMQELAGRALRSHG
jgi:hypothetical protein